MTETTNSDYSCTELSNSFRFVDVQSEILKGKEVKPGILNDETIDLTTEARPAPIPSYHHPKIRCIPTAALTNPKPSGLTGIPLQTPKPAANTTQPRIMLLNPSAQSTQNVAVNSLAPASIPRTFIAKPASNSPKQIGMPLNGEQIQVLNVNSLSVGNKLNTVNTASAGGSVYLIPASFFLNGNLRPNTTIVLPPIPMEPVVERKKEELPEPLHPCWKRKRHRKLDLEGFSLQDRLGFTATECSRVKRCTAHINSLISTEEAKIYELERRLDKVRLMRVEKKYNIKDCTIMLDRNDVKSYYHNIKNRKRQPVILQRWLKAAEPLKCTPRPIYREMDMPALKRLDYNEKIIFINDHNFGRLNYMNHLKDTIIFISSNPVTTEMCLQKFPLFRNVVQKGVVQIVNEQMLQEFCVRHPEMGLSEHIPRRVGRVKQNTQKFLTFKRFYENGVGIDSVAQRQYRVDLDHKYAMELSTEGLGKLCKS